MKAEIGVILQYMVSYVQSHIFPLIFYVISEHPAGVIEVKTYIQLYINMFLCLISVCTKFSNIASGVYIEENTSIVLFETVPKAVHQFGKSTNWQQCCP